MSKRSAKLLSRLLSFSVAISIWLGVAIAQQTQKSDVDKIPDAIYKELNGIDKNRHREIRQSQGTRRVTTSVDELKAKYDMSPRGHNCPVYFGQANVQHQFGQSGIFRRATIDDVAAKLKAGEIRPDDVPIQFVWVDGKRVTVNNRSLTVLYKAGIRPTKLIDRSETLPVQGSESLEAVLKRLEAMAGKPSTEMLVRTPGIGSDGRPREATDWDAPIGEIVSMPDDVIAHAKNCDVGAAETHHEGHEEHEGNTK